ncbi:hypothetical protein FY034_17385 (plasmid) [Trichlorobacter lovleyi]|uniref:hypothetical protein n=1 Tax=Trichlorobacter lovleyi TaxID=313985 RepID=UPI00223FB564|nr:hypothetical protein [Trichlorobacter lovleyi]QOX80797.1 hypothetical protein FY034_17385 [Trichlorobacter lovleyi]
MKNIKTLSTATTMCAVFAIAVSVFGATKSYASDIMMSVLLKSPVHEVASDIYARYGSPSPNAMAIAITSTEKPHLSMAQSIIESAGNPSAVGLSGEEGGWQVIPDCWWPVPKKPRDQAVQAQTILSLLGNGGNDTSLMRMQTALRKYNGSIKNQKTRVYADKVLQLAFSIAVETGGTL